jgi:hypothetical protein
MTDQPQQNNKLNCNECGFGQDEIEQLEKAFQEYSETVELYEKLIKIEYDPQRREILEKLLVAFCEENK